MGRTFGLGRRQSFASLVWIALFASELAACSLEQGAPQPDPDSASTAPVNSAATLSGAGGFASQTAGRGSGDDTLFGDFGGAKAAASAGGKRGGTDSGSASASAGGVGGTTSNRGGAAAGKGGRAGADNNAGAAGSNANSLPPALFFSEYIEGSSTNKALEIAALHDSPLEGCKVNVYFNGKTEATLVAALSGSLAEGQVLTLCTSTLKTQLGAVCSQVGHLTFNGNDALAISCSDQILDVIGQVGNDPGAAWGTGDTTTLDHTLQRKCRITTGDSDGLDAFDPTVEWQASPIDSFWGLGSRGC